MTPLAVILRPKTLDDLVGQDHLTNQNSILRKLIESNNLTSTIFYGPPGIGKTTIAEIIANTVKTEFFKFNATSIKIADVRKLCAKAIKSEEKLTIFIDEIHRLSKNQAEVLLPYVENNQVILVGATTENPFHAVGKALLSRSSIFQLNPLTQKALLQLIGKALNYYKNKGLNPAIEQEALKHIMTISCGDGRKAINTVELIIEHYGNLTLENAKLVAPSKYMVFGKDEHFDLASAYQGSIQASDPDAAIFWLAKWLESGEDPRYIARRLMVSASEDAAGNPEAATVAHNAYIAAKEIGRPECDIILAHATILTATAPRNKSAAKAIWAAVADVKQNKEEWVPKEMKDSHYPGAKKLGNGIYKDGMNKDFYVGIDKKYYLP